MATYSVTLVPAVPDALNRPCPWGPVDITADSEDAAIREMEQRMGAHEEDVWWLQFIEGPWNPPSTEGWKPQAQLVRRPTVELRTRSADGQKAEMYDVLLDDEPHGVLRRKAADRKRYLRPTDAPEHVWFIDDARGLLARLADRTWPDYARRGPAHTFWAGLRETVLEDIRGALETQ